MTQPFVMRYPLIIGQGNFGSLDGDPAAAMRYTEAKLSPIGHEMLKNIDVAEYKDNFDNTLKEPTYLNGFIPNILINGFEGIAVGMASSTLPHNLVEVYDALIHILNNYIQGIENTDKVVLEHVLGPDFPLGGSLIGKAGIEDYLRTGEGKAVLRSKYIVETTSTQKKIIITELPFRVNKKDLIDKINLLTETKLKEVKSAVDETDREGVSIVIHLRKEANIEAVVRKLCKFTNFQVNVHANYTLLIGGVPKTIGFLPIMEDFIVGCYETMVKLLQKEYEQVLKRLNYLSIIIWAVDPEITDAIIPLIRACKTIESLKEALNQIEPDITLEHTKIVKGIRLGELNPDERQKFVDEFNACGERAQEIEETLQDENKIYQLLINEYTRLKDTLGDPRRTLLLPDTDSGDYDEENDLEEENLLVFYTSDHLIKTCSQGEFRKSKRGTKGVAVNTNDAITFMLSASNKDTLLFFTNKGRCHRYKAYLLPKVSRNAKGKSINNFLTLEEGERVVAIQNITLAKDQSLIFVTKQGMIKKLNSDQLSVKYSITKVISFSEGDELVSVKLAQDNNEIIICTSQGLATHFALNDIRSTGRAAKGVIGMKFGKANDYVVDFAIASHKDHSILTVTSEGFGKRTDFDKFRITSKGGKGCTCHKLNNKTGNLIAAIEIEADSEVFITTQKGQTVRFDVDTLKTYSKTAGGVKIINLDSDDTITSVTSQLKEGEEIEQSSSQPTNN